MGGVDYTAIAIGDGVNQPLSLLALVDDNTAPAAGNFKLRLGHLAPFADTLAGTMADVRLDDGTAVITDVVFGAVAPYLELPAGTYDLKITTPGGGTTLINLAPVTFNGWANPVCLCYWRRDEPTAGRVCLAERPAGLCTSIGEYTSSTCRLCPSSPRSESHALLAKIWAGYPAQIFL